MTYVVTDACIKRRYMNSVEVCSVDCFYEGERMLVIHPDEFIDCGISILECPVDPIPQDSEGDLETWLALHARYARICPTLAARDKLRPMRSIGRTWRTNLIAVSALVSEIAAMDEDTCIASRGGVAGIAIRAATKTDRPAIRKLG